MGNDNVSFEVIRVFLLIENHLLREALVRIFRKSAHITVVGQSGRTDSTAQDILDSDSDVLVISPF
jgi:two-component system, NarL family, nitrate/nitrite response regulator NarL